MSCTKKNCTAFHNPVTKNHIREIPNMQNPKNFPPAQMLFNKFFDSK